MATTTLQNYSGQLRSNEIFAALYNMIISQQVFADNIKGTNSSLVDQARVDGGLYGDTKLYYSTDVLKSAPWGKDTEATNLLALHRPEAPEVQAISLDKFRQISLTVDNYMSKRAFSTEGAFSEFNSVMTGWIRDTKKIYDATTYNAFFGSAIDEDSARGTVEITLEKNLEEYTGEERNRLEAQMIAQTIADLITDMTDVSRDFNAYGNLRSYNEDEIKIVWNAKWLNKITKLDLPTIFNAEGLMDKFKDKLPARYFGEVVLLPGTVAKGNPERIRALVEKDYVVGGVTHHLFPGDLLPDDAAYTGSDDSQEVYKEYEDIICKVYVKLPPYMSAFEVGTSFFNPKSLTENHYLTWGHNTLETLKNYPFITVRAV